MQTFRFSLESILNLNNRSREECLGRLSIVNRRILDIQQKLASIESERESLRDHLRSHSSRTVVDIGLISRCQLHLTQLELQQTQLEMELTATQSEFESRRKEVVEAEKKVKALEKLREKQFSEYKRHLEVRSRQEQMDIIAARLTRGLES